MGPTTSLHGDDDARAWLHRRQRLGVHLGLERPRRLLEKLGAPQQGLPAIQVVGTNGKGTVSSLLAAALSAEGYRTGLYLSPHVSRFSERIQVDGRPIADAAVDRAIGRVRTAAQEMPDDPPTFFECLTAAALVAFGDLQVDVVVLEAGLGGRLDATSLGESIMTVVTDIAMDHEDALGGSLAQIAQEKAGAFGHHVPAVARAGDAAWEVLAANARRKGTRLQRVLTAGTRIRTQGWDGMRVSLDAWGRRREFALASPGRHQADNLTTAVRALELLPRFRVLPETAYRAFAGVRLPGRLERIGDGPSTVLDIAHNPSAVGAVARALDDLGPNEWSLVFGTSRDKDAKGMLSILAPHCRQAIVCAAASPRAAAPADLARAAQDAGLRVRKAATAAEAWDAASAGPHPVLVTGSSFVVGEVRNRALGLPEPNPPEAVQ